MTMTIDRFWLKDLKFTGTCVESEIVFAELSSFAISCSLGIIVT
jgi:hypothetical protein